MTAKRNISVFFNLLLRTVPAHIFVAVLVLCTVPGFAQTYLNTQQTDESVADIFDHKKLTDKPNEINPQLDPMGTARKKNKKSSAKAEKDPPFMVRADGMAQDKETGIMVAQGNVEIVYGTQVVTADEIIYYPQQDRVEASGHVSILDEDGNVYFAQAAELSDKMKKGFVKEVYGILSDGSHLAARSGKRIAGDKTEMNIAVFSPCDVCKENPDKPPLWQIKATKVIHDEKKQDIVYHNARMEMFGVPVFYTPYLSHPAPNVERRSGLLKPSFGFSSKHGYIADSSYYHVISPSEDATFRLVNTKNTGTLTAGEWRKRFDKGDLFINTGLNYSERRNSDGEILKEADFRGHIFANGNLDINNNWRSGFSFSRATDTEYLEDFYASSGKDVLTNTVYAQRLAGRDITDIQAVHFYDLRPNASGDQPQLLPWVRHSMTGSPDSIFGGRGALNLEGLSLVRNDSQSVYRLSAAPSWSRETVFSSGIASRFDVNSRFNSYTVDNPYIPSEKGDTYSQETMFGNLHTENRLPLIKPMSFGYAQIEPRISLTVAPNQTTDSDIPNEDSKDVQLDYSNLFAADRYTGSDRHESGTHVAYGIKTGLYDNYDRYISAALGQSFRLSGDPEFPDGSGLERRRSDLVGTVDASVNDNLKFDYRFQLNEETLADVRHELQSDITYNDASFTTTYLYAEEVEGTELTNRQQLTLQTTLPMTEYWDFTAATLHDLSGDAGLLKAQTGFIYQDECFKFSSVMYRNMTDESSAGSSFTILFTLGYKKLGEFLAPAIDEDFIGSIFGSGNEENTGTDN